MTTYPQIINKILKHEHVIFYSPHCRYSMDAINHLDRLNLPDLRKYEIEKLRTEGSQMNFLLNVLREYKTVINFDEQHYTKPIIFINGKFIGGYTDLIKYHI